MGFWALNVILADAPVISVTPLVGPIKLLAVGDSNTSGGYVGQAWSVWPDRVQTALAAQYPSTTVTATNNAVGGTTTYELSVNYATWVGDESPSVIVCVEGTNDVHYDTPSPGGAPRGDGVDYSATAARARVEAIIESARTLTDTVGRRAKFVLCSPPPAAVLADGTTLWRDATRLSAMRDAMAAAATARGVTFVDLWTLMQVNPAWKTDYLTDGVHLTNAGQQFVADQIAAAVTPVPPSGELGIGTEGISTVTVTAVSASKSGTDSATASESASISSSVTGANVSSSDTGTGTETSSVSTTIEPGPITPPVFEGFVIDGLDVNTAGVYALEEFVLGPPPKRYEWISNNDIDGADLLRKPSQDNRPFTLKVRLRGDTRDQVQAAHHALVQKFEQAEKNGRDGITAVWTPADSSTSYDVTILSGETTDFPVTVESGYFVYAPLITFQGTAKAAIYGPEQVYGPVSGSTPLLEIEIAGASGQLPAEATITVGDTAGRSRRHVTWGLEQRYYDPDSPTSLVLDADDMTTSGYAGSLTTRAGSYGANVVRVTDLPTNRWTAVAGLTSQPHVGVFRVPVRGYGDSSTSLRISWRAGDGPFTAYPAVTVPVDGWFEIDLGAVVIPPAPIGAQTWDCRVEAMSTAIGSDLDLDFTTLIPAGEGFGRARAVAGNDAAGVVNGFDDFSAGTLGANLNGSAADGGGAWASAGATGDFQYSDGLPSGSMAALRDSILVEGSPRIMVLGSTSYTDTQAEIGRGTSPGGVSWGGKPGGAIARYVDASNYVYAKRTPSGPFQLGYVLAGTPVPLASGTYAAPASGALEAIILLVYASGRAIARLVDAYGNEQLYLEASSSVLATSGALASGKPGVFDQSTDTAAVNRFYEGFTHSVPAPEIVALNANRTLAFRHDTVRRENATGTAYGEPGMYRGGPAYVPPAGDQNLTSRVVAVLRRNDIDESTSDDVTDASTLAVTLRPGYFYPA